MSLGVARVKALGVEEDEDVAEVELEDVELGCVMGLVPAWRTGFFSTNLDIFLRCVGFSAVFLGSGWSPG